MSMNKGPKIYVNVQTQKLNRQILYNLFLNLLDESLFSQLLTEIDIYIDMTILTDWNSC